MYVSSRYIICFACIGTKDKNVRLFDFGETVYPSEGIVDVYVNGSWGSICVNDWDVVDASVACVSLGFTEAVKAHYLYRASIKKMCNVRCSGNESTIFDCPHSEPMENDFLPNAAAWCLNDTSKSINYAFSKCTGLL